MKTLKWITCILLTLALLGALAGCGSSGGSSTVGNGGTGSSDIDIDTLADAERANFPAPTEDFSTVMAEAGADKKTLDVHLGKLIAAYENMEAEEFCKYAYELNAKMDDYLTNLHDSIAAAAKLLGTEATEESAAKTIDLTTFSYTFITIQTAWKGWNVDYLACSTNQKNAPTYDELMEDMKPIINDYSDLLYGKDMVY